MKKKVFLGVVIILFSQICALTGQVHAASAKWTFMVYMAGQNNLSPEVLQNVLDMMKVGSDADVNIVIQAGLDSLYTPQVPDTTAYRCKVLKNGLDCSAMGYDADMSATQTLTDFITWATSAFPANRYALVLWDHGLGWLGGAGRGNGSWSRSIFENDNNNSFMSINGLDTALRQAGVYFDLIDFDACLMGMWEVLGGMYGQARYVTFSETSVPGNGNPYSLILSDLIENPDMDGRQLGAAIVDDYISYYKTPGQDQTSVTKSLVDTSAVPALNTSIQNLGETLYNNLDANLKALTDVSGKVQSYQDMPGSVDLGDLCDNLAILGQPIAQYANQVKDILEGQVVLKSGLFSSSYSIGNLLNSSNVDRSHGLAINFPSLNALSQDEITQYQTLDVFNQAPQWASFIAAFIEKTQGISAAKVTGNFMFTAYWQTLNGGTSMADLDLYIIEPDGVFAPWMGSTTPNGFFSPDSSVSGKSFESYTALPKVTSGLYIPAINFYSGGPSNEQSVLAYCLYNPDISSWNPTSFGPQKMGLWNPAPKIWNDNVIQLLSQNYYSDWWIPTSVEKMLSRMPIRFKRAFWNMIQTQKKEKIQKRTSQWPAIYSYHYRSLF